MGTYKQAQREKYSTVKVNGKPAYPIGDKAHAKLALSQINRGGLSSSQKSEVRVKAAKFGVGKTGSTTTTRKGEK